MPLSPTYILNPYAPYTYIPPIPIHLPRNSISSDTRMNIYKSIHLLHTRPLVYAHYTHIPPTRLPYIFLASQLSSDTRMNVYKSTTPLPCSTESSRATHALTYIAGSPLHPMSPKPYVPITLCLPTPPSSLPLAPYTLCLPTPPSSFPLYPSSSTRMNIYKSMTQSNSPLPLYRPTFSYTHYSYTPYTYTPYTYTPEFYPQDESIQIDDAFTLFYGKFQSNAPRVKSILDDIDQRTEKCSEFVFACILFLCS